jgi:DNA-binding NarL/FixJ family response regulator
MTMETGETLVTTVLICDDHRRFREHLRRFVAAVPGVDRVATADTSAETFVRYAAELPALVLLDVAMPELGGPETARRLVAAHPGANVVMLAGSADHDRLAQAMAGGARGYLTKDVAVEELCAALAHVVVDAGIQRANNGHAQATPIDPPLTERERQVLDGMSRGKTNNEIGRELFLSEDTVKTHARRLFRKLGVNDRAQAVALGFRSGIVR